MNYSVQTATDSLRPQYRSAELNCQASISNLFARTESVPDTRRFADRFLRAWQLYERAEGGRITGRRLADALGVSPATITAWASADEPPPHAQILAVAKLTGTDPGWLAYAPDTSAQMRREWSAERGELEPKPKPGDAGDGHQRGRKHG